MQFKWVVATGNEDNGALFVKGTEFFHEPAFRLWKLQVGHYEVAREQDNGAGGTMQIMEMRWHDVHADDETPR